MNALKVDKSLCQDVCSKELPNYNNPSSVFRGELNQTISCLNVSFSSIRKQSFLDLSLTASDVDNIEESLYDMLLPEYLTGDNQYRTKEYGLQDAVKTLSITTLPPILNIHLKRFSYNMYSDKQDKVCMLVHSIHYCVVSIIIIIQIHRFLRILEY